VFVAEYRTVKGVREFFGDFLAARLADFVWAVIAYFLAQVPSIYFILFYFVTVAILKQ
jgi:hypothetical protein